MAIASSAFIRVATTSPMFAIPKEYHDSFAMLDISASATLGQAQFCDSPNAPLSVPSAHSQEQASAVEGSLAPDAGLAGDILCA